MGFPLPVGYPELVIPIPKLFLQLLCLLGFIKRLITIIFFYMGLPHFLEPDLTWPDSTPEFQPVSPQLIREILPVVKFSEVSSLVDSPPERCAVCLYEFEVHDEIRRLVNCRHIFHRGCLDRWMGYHHGTCPLCRTAFIPVHMQGAFNHALWAASGFPDS
jgi:RING-H2 zinc finger protein RHA1